MSLKLIPSEINCYYCKMNLSLPYIITSKASILTLNTLNRNVSTYFLKCENCGMYYIYQEYQNGIHNYNNVFHIGIEACLFFTESLQHYIPIGSVVKVLEKRLQTKLNTKMILNTYLHFEAMSYHKYNFHCSICGFYPVTHIMDLNRKVCFKLAVKDVTLSKRGLERDGGRSFIVFLGE